MPKIIRGLSCKELNLNKITKIWLNAAAGILISGLLLWSLWLQVQEQISQMEYGYWWESESGEFLILGLFLVPVNIGMEILKWKILASGAQPTSFKQAIKSYFAGIAISLVTPNRIGEYPGRILFLGRKNTVRLISVSILGAFSQFISLFIFGMAGLIFYNVYFPGYWQKLALTACILMLLLTVLLFFQFEKIAGKIEKYKLLRRFQTYGYLMQRFSSKEQWGILGISILRLSVLIFQYLILLRWMHVPVPPLAGIFMAALYFWSIAVVPSIAFAELGVRGQISLFIFHHFSENTIGILSATIGLWCINLIVPALIGSILLLRVKILK